MSEAQCRSTMKPTVACQPGGVLALFGQGDCSLEIEMADLVAIGLFAGALYLICRDATLAEGLFILGGILAAVWLASGNHPPQ